MKYTIPKLKRDTVLKRCHNRCANPSCRSTENLTIDHIIPLSKGGSNKLCNLQALCFNCNQEKADGIANYLDAHLRRSQIFMVKQYKDRIKDLPLYSELPKQKPKPTKQINEANIEKYKRVKEFRQKAIQNYKTASL